MKISLSWLGEYITFTESDPQKIADAITAHTAEVDEIEVQGKLLENCCMGKILSIAKHPDADRLNVCEVLTDKGTQTVVCGGTNLRVGMRVGFAHVGANARMPDGGLLKLESIKIRGVESNGMICAASELELEDLYPPTEDQGKKPIIDFGDGDENVGKPLGEVLGLDDIILHIDNHAITQRADLFSHLGFAFECVAIGIATWKNMPEFTQPEFTHDPLPFTMKVESKHLMPRYCSCMITIDDLGETPEWMKRKLAAVGWRPLNLPIDITNFVASEIGVPLHSFDADDIKGTVHMRVSKKGEKITTLDNQERTLPDGAMILSDDEGIFDLLGIMGGLRSSTKPTTRHIYLHSASLDPVAIRNTVIATGHRTDAATVYEKGVPHITTQIGFYRAVQLFLDLVPGARISSEQESVGDNGTAKPIDLFVDRVCSVLGVTIDAAAMTKILTDLAFEVSDKGKGVLAVTPPLHRLGDITGPHDLTEEIGRIYGYNNIENTLPSASIQPPKRDTRLHAMRDRLVDQDFTELLPLSLIGPDLLKKAKIDVEGTTELVNPLGHETSIMAPSTIPALLEQAGKNMLEVSDSLKTFHVSTVFAGGSDSHTELGALVAMRSSADLLSDPLLTLKQEVTSAVEQAGYTVTIDVSSDVPSFASKGRCADLHVNGEVVGTLFEIHPDVCSNFDLPSRAAGLTINVTALFGHAATEVVYGSIPEFPAVRYDTTVSMSHSKSVAAVLTQIRESSPLLESAEVVDLYGKESDDYKLTIRCLYRSAEKTLTEEEAKKEFAKVEKILG